MPKCNDIILVRLNNIDGIHLIKWIVQFKLIILTYNPNEPMANYKT